MRTILLITALMLAISSSDASARGWGHHRGGVDLHFGIGLPFVYGPVYPSYRYYYPYYSPYYYPPPPPPTYYYYQEPAIQPQHVPAPDIQLETAPEFIYSKELGFFVSVGIPYDIMYIGTKYYVFSGGYWYRGPFYNGPWEVVSVSNMPDVLIRQDIGKIRYQRDIEFRRFKSAPERYDGQFHRPEFR